MVHASELTCVGNIDSILGSQGEFWGKISTDSRTLQEGDIFIGLRGEKFDAFHFIESVCEKNPGAIVYNYNDDSKKKVQELLEIYPSCLFIGVEDTLLYLQLLASVHLQFWKEENKGTVIGITGSNGKTTTKEMLVEMLSAVFPGEVHGTQGNFNNHIGVPLTLLGITEKHRYVVVELGTNHPGEIEMLCHIADPDVGLITSIGSSHLEFFHTEDAVFVEKRHLYQYVCAKNGSFVVNDDDLFLRQLKSGIHFGKNSDDFKLILEDGRLELHGRDQNIKIKNRSILGDYNFYNLAASFLVARLFTSNEDGLLRAASNFEPKNNRSSWLNVGRTRVFLDAYNANPSSMSSALQSFHRFCQQEKLLLAQCLMILGDMNELGAYATQKHCEVGALVRSLGFTRVIFVGRYAKSYGEGFGAGAILVGQKEQFDWEREIGASEICFIKGSRSLKLETLVQMR